MKTKKLGVILVLVLMMSFLFVGQLFSAEKPIKIRVIQPLTELIAKCLP